MKLVPSALLFSLVFASGVSFASGPCTAATFGDGVCDCGCGSNDPDCPPRTMGTAFTVCQVSHCASGQVPWEHQPSTCMNSACGDGWNDPNTNEVCDDGNALASGGCAANCRSVNPGYTCGPNASKCRLAPVDAGTDAGVDAGVDAGTLGAGPDAGSPGVDASAVDAGADELPRGELPKTGCSALGGELLWLASLLMLRARRTRAD